MNTLELKSIIDLQGMSFYIPAYQRGYRWTVQQVEDLLGDISEFIKKGGVGIYCLQPLVVVKRYSGEIMTQIHNAENVDEVKRILKGQWEVVDGQQRLTTTRLILDVLKEPYYDIQYETRNDSEEYLKDINSLTFAAKKEDNIDYYHIWKAADTIKGWLEKHKDVDVETFKHILLNQVKSIWYETSDKNPKEVFTRLNIGKISLTNAELIKALLLNKSNFNSNDNNKIRMWQQEIAMEWDVIEYSLQSRDFWLFLNDIGYEHPTRIDFIFDMIYEQDMLRCGSNIEKISADELHTFRYFNHFMEQQRGLQVEKSIRKIWEKVMEIYQTLKEWFDDKDLYHYVGFLICNGRSINKIYAEWLKCDSKSDFRNYYLISEIKKCIKNKDLDTTLYEKYGNGGAKTNCRPILLLHNIQTIINQNQVLNCNNKYGTGVFYKFPFHLYKSEGWDIEHIDSNTENALNDIKSQREWLLNSYFGLSGDENVQIRKEIEVFFNQYSSKVYNNNDVEDKKVERNKQFEQLYAKIIDGTGKGIRKLTQEEKNMIWNFTLLDSSTNRSYGNSIFPAKRRVIIGKEQGKLFQPPFLDTEGQIVAGATQAGQSSFIPPCTKYVFMKYYNAKSFTPNEWSRDDAEAYLINIKETLKEFLS